MTELGEGEKDEMGKRGNRVRKGRSSGRKGEGGGERGSKGEEGIGRKGGKEVGWR